MSNGSAKSNLLYEPPPSVSPSFWEEFNRIVPEAPCGGGVKKLRFVWGNDRRDYVAGHQVIRYGDLDNDPPKYVGRARWVLEGWQSPDVFDKEQWLKDEHLLGPWPANGVWDFIEIHEDSEGNYLPLDHTAIERVKSWNFWQSKSRARSIEFLMEQMTARWAFQDQREREAQKKVSTAFGEEVVKCFENQNNPVSSLPAQQKQEKGFKVSPGGILVPA